MKKIENRKFKTFNRNKTKMYSICCNLFFIQLINRIYEIIAFEKPILTVHMAIFKILHFIIFLKHR